MVDTWQEDTETGRIVRVAKAAEGTAKPTLPTAGTSIDWADTGSGGAVVGWTASDFEFTEDDFELTPRESDPIIVDPPSSEAKIAEIYDKIESIDQVNLTSYEVGSKLFTWDTSWSESAGVWTAVVPRTRVAFALEYAGLMLLYFPSVEIHAMPPTGGYKALGTQPLSVHVFKHSTAPGGVIPYFYQDA